MLARGRQACQPPEIRPKPPETARTARLDRLDRLEDSMWLDQYRERFGINIKYLCGSPRARKSTPRGST